LLGHHAADQQKPVADRRVFLAAHEGHAVLLHAAHQPLDALPERFRTRHPVVQGIPLRVVVLRIGGPPAKLIAQENVADSLGGQSGLELLGVELRCISAVGRGPDVGQDVDPVLQQQLAKVVLVMIGMANGVQDRICRSHKRHSPTLT
jgi:hypothetical protein